MPRPHHLRPVEDPTSSDIKRMSRPASQSFNEGGDFVDLQLDLLCAISVLAHAWEKGIG